MIAFCRCAECRAVRERRLDIRRKFFEEINGFRYGRHDAAIVAALQHLREIEPDPAAVPDVSRIRVGPLDADTFAQVDVDSRGKRWVYVSSTSPFYRMAERGDVTPLAIVLHHEMHHVRFGSDEPSAYRATLKLARRSQTAPDVLRFIEQVARDNGLT